MGWVATAKWSQAEVSRFHQAMAQAAKMDASVENMEERDAGFGWEDGIVPFLGGLGVKCALVFMVNLTIFIVT